MRTLIIATALAGLFSVDIASAQTVRRDGTIVGPAGGTSTYGRTRTYAPGSVQTQGRITGPAGNTVTRSGGAQRVAPGQWTTGATVAGPGGRTVQRSSNVTVTPAVR
jgi:hypothetical protein